eukprot:GHVH01006976.1.p1 GENE.GHVH01006976.1~~GHVH01006976.1.p1  ORF type:complete len:713 (+),score=81.65 GHVH01006976.1:1502-3640(+)
MDVVKTLIHQLRTMTEVDLSCDFNPTDRKCKSKPISKCVHYERLLERVTACDEPLQSYLATHVAPLSVVWSGYSKKGPNHANEDRISSSIFPRWLHVKRQNIHNKMIMHLTPIPPAYYIVSQDVMSTAKKLWEIGATVGSDNHGWNEDILGQLDDDSRRDVLLEWHNKLWKRYSNYRSTERGVNCMSQIKPKNTIFTPKHNSLTKRIKLKKEFVGQFGSNAINLGRASNSHDDFLETGPGLSIGVEFLLVAFLQKSELSNGFSPLDLDGSEAEVIYPDSSERWICHCKVDEFILKAYRKTAKEWVLDEANTKLLNLLVPRRSADNEPFRVVYEPVFDTPSLSLSVGDGHDQSIASQCVVENIGRSLQHAWHRGYLPHDPNSSDSVDTDRSNPRGLRLGEARDRANVTVLSSTMESRENVVKDVYEDCMAALENVFRVTAYEHFTAFEEELTSGSCVISSLMVHDSIYTAELGDSMACVLTLSNPTESTPPDIPADLPSIDAKLPSDYNGTAWRGKLDYGFQVVWLSKPMRCDAPYERERIADLGGDFGQDGRLAGLLEPTRSIGDLDVKEMTPNGVVSIVPEVTHHRITRPSLIIIGSDGPFDILGADDLICLFRLRQNLWKRICSWMSYRPVEDWITLSADKVQPLTYGTPSQEDLQEIGKLICHVAIYSGSRDDCSIVVVYAQPIIGVGFSKFQEEVKISAKVKRSKSEF